jgi:ribosomal protein S18 acetylase RimI-like enzyme
VRAAVVQTNIQVLSFWQRCGFRDTGERKPYKYDKLVSSAIILDRPVGQVHI